MDGRQGKHKEPGKGREAHEHHRPGDPAQPQPGRSSREKEKGQKAAGKETSRGREDDLLREEDLHDEGL
ncbi:hypothetical protein ABZ605_04780 [Streptomyces sp. NPDC012765]|uniref:hypothetical protein n=1 Tax=Streptomyces sp. NPDC012765 TaxID=3155249 RepID=UPI0033EA3839